MATQPANAASSGFLANDVYFMDSLDGKIRGYDASTGKLLWTSPAIASPASDLTVSGNTLLFGATVPKLFGGHGPSGVYALRLNG